MAEQAGGAPPDPDDECVEMMPLRQRSPRQQDNLSNSDQRDNPKPTMMWRRTNAIIVAAASAVAVVFVTGYRFFASPVDKHRPTVGFIQPASSRGVSTVGLGVIVDARSPSSESRIESVSLYIDKSPYGTKTTAPYSWGMCENQDGHNGKPLEPGTRILEAVARDSEGRETTATHHMHIVGPPILRTGHSDYDSVHDLAIAEMGQNVVCDHFVAGEGWDQLWTRDTSYAAEQGAGLVHPDVVRLSLEASVEVDEGGAGTVWLQDECGHFGGWPKLSDAIVGARGAWSAYRMDGNRTFLSWSFEVTKNSLVRAERDVYDPDSGLFRGCSSFMESNSGYPKKYKGNGFLVGKTKALSTNLLYYTGYRVSALMGKELGASNSEVDGFVSKAENLKEAIISRLWIPEKGYFAYFEDENGKLVKNMEGLGESLALLEIESDSDRITSIFKNTYDGEYGIPCLWPQFDLGPREDIANYYHNGLLWPFVQGYWALAAVKHGKVDVFASALHKLLALAQKKNTFSEFYELDGTFPTKRRRQLWSDTAYLAMVYQGLFGMSYETDGVRFSPIKPAASTFAEEISLEDFRYRGMNLNIQVKGTGSSIEFFSLDGRDKTKDPFVPSGLTGTHSIRIVVGDVENPS